MPASVPDPRSVTCCLLFCTARVLLVKTYFFTEAYLEFTMPSLHCCYVCGFSFRNTRAAGLSFHCVSKRITKRPIAEKWLKFLLLPSTNLWPDQRWTKIKLCSIHFIEEDYSGRQVCCRKVLKDDAVPTKNPPNGPGLFGPLFHQGEANTVPCENPPQAEEPRVNDIGPLKLEVFDSPENLSLAEDPEVHETDPLKLEVSDFDPAFCDHNYIGALEPFDEQNNGDPKENGEDPSNQLVLQDLKKELCRLCGKKGLLLMPIFNLAPCAGSGEITLSDKIVTYLPLKVKMEDPLPSHICIWCSELLSRWHELYLTCVAADAVLWKTFGGESDVSSQKDQDCCSNRNQENAAQCTDNAKEQVMADNAKEPVMADNAKEPVMADNAKEPVMADNAKEPVMADNAKEPVMADNAKEPVMADNAKELEMDTENGESLNKANEEHEVLCSVCGMNTPSNPAKEDDPLIEEFKKFRSEVRSFQYKCRYCSEFFFNPGAKKEHIKKCRELSTLCEWCGKNDICRKDLQRHKYRKHHKVVVEITCDRCGKYFKSRALFKRHYFLIHVQGLEKRFCCCHCCSAYADEKIYRSHMKRHERGELKTVFQIEKYLDGGVYVCPVCKEIFNDSLSLVLHLIAQKKIKCPSCLKLIPNEKRFMLHVCKEWLCRYCSKSHKVRLQCVMHERLHTGEKPIRCRTCDRRFHSYRSRNSHETTHAPSFECTICNKKIRNKYNFQDHLQWHDGKVFLCSICRKGFRTRNNVRKHASKVHKSGKVEVIVANL